MKLLNVTFLPQLNKNTAIADVAKALEGEDGHKIDIAPWPIYPYKPGVSFKIAHSEDCIFLEYFVAENEMRIQYQHCNEAVYRDSCVEFFISFEGKEYYNLEFNSIGTCLAGFGENREKRNFLPADTIEKINFSSSMQVTKTANRKLVTWQLLLIIPVDVFCYHNFTTLHGLAGFGNFYKCGDDLEQQHYLAWNPVTSPGPDFHLMEFFGAVKFT